MLLWTGRYDSNVPLAKRFSDPWVKHLSCECECESERECGGEIENEIGAAAPQKDSTPKTSIVNPCFLPLVLAISFDRGLGKIRKVAQSRQGDMMLIRKSTELGRGEHGEHGKQGPGQHDELTILSFFLFLSLFLFFSLSLPLSFSLSFSLSLSFDALRPWMLSKYRSRPHASAMCCM